MILVNKKLSEGLLETDKEIENNPFYQEMIDKINHGKEWFENNNSSAYEILFFQDILNQQLIDSVVQRFKKINEVYTNIKSEKDVLKQESLIKKYTIDDKENFNLYNIMAYNQYDQRKYKKGIKYVEMVIEKDPGNAAFYDTVGLGYYYLKIITKLEMLNKSIELKPEGKEVAEHYYNRGRVFEKLNAKSRAIRDYQTALKNDENYESAKSALRKLT